MNNTKKCNGCLVFKSLDNFRKHGLTKDGYNNYCKSCKKIKDASYYKQTKDKRAVWAKDYYAQNKSKVLARKEKNKDQILQYNKYYYAKNKDRRREYRKQYRLDNKEKIAIQRKLYRQLNREKINLYTKNKLKNDPFFKLAKTLRKRIGELIRIKGFVRNRSFEDYIGCNREQLINHIETQFKEGMTWENHGEWHVDHKIPLANALTTQQLYTLAHYKNLRPLWAEQNQSKLNKVVYCFQKLKRDITEYEDSNYPKDLKVSDFTFNNEGFNPEHREFIEKYEWLGTIGFGIKWVFTARYNGILAGVIIMSQPNAYQFNKELECLIQRGACASWAPKNLNSAFLMFSCRWVVKNTEKRLFTAYSDPMAGEYGTIYQACNFDYLGQEYGSSKLYLLNTGKWVNARYFTRTNNIKKWAKILQIEWKPEWTNSKGFQDTKQIPKEVLKTLRTYGLNMMKSLPHKKIQAKGKYVLLLNYGKNKIAKTWEPKPYPKRLILE